MSEPQRPSRNPSPARAGGWSLRVGSALGIPIRIHFTFLLLLLWFGAVSASQGEGFLGGVIFLLLLFGCVVLHELGHAAAARGFGVETREIVLYPIGGIARLDRIPSGKAELVIALAGPAVNLILAGALFVFLIFQQVRTPVSAEELVGGGAPIVWQLLMANLILAFFNLIPAFPMDGGRVLRATLSLFLGQDRATNIAATVGQGMAILFAVLALFPPPVKPVLLLIAIFVFLGAGQEAAFQRGRSAVRGLTAQAAMVTRFETLKPEDSLGRAAELLLATHQHDFPVIDAWGRVAGVLHRSALLAGLAGEGRDHPVLELMDRQPIAVAPETPLEEVLRLLQARPLGPILVVGEQGLAGMITFENFGELIEVSRSLRRTGGPV
ncbi:MAG: site-2 protease family protein [Holophagales bacterium]|nr:site-2 protease family protein [Holophagales bacterium]